MLGNTRLARALHLACLAVFGLAFAALFADPEALRRPGDAHLGLAGFGVAAALLAGMLDPDASRARVLCGEIVTHAPPDVRPTAAHSPAPAAPPANRRRRAP